jgi:hypothetical protein
MIRSGWLIVLAAGILAAVVRVAGPPPVADAIAMAYLILATVTFGRSRIDPAPNRVTVRRDFVGPDRRG